MNAIEVWRDFHPGEATIRSMVFEDAWYPEGVKDGRLVPATMPGAKAAHRIIIEETANGEMLEVVTDGE
jgi:hypothetical protein